MRLREIRCGTGLGLGEQRGNAVRRRRHEGDAFQDDREDDPGHDHRQRDLEPTRGDGRQWPCASAAFRQLAVPA